METARYNMQYRSISGVERAIITGLSHVHLVSKLLNKTFDLHRIIIAGYKTVD